jgi:hypothetical protein
MEVGARVDVVRDAGGDDGENVRRALSTFIEPGEKPVASPEDKPPELALATIVGRLDVSVVEEEQEAPPLSVQIAERLAEWRLGRDVAASAVEPFAELEQERPGVLVAPYAACVGGIAGERGLPLDRKEGSNEADAFERDGVAAFRRLDESAPSMSPTARSLPAGALDEG